MRRRLALILSITLLLCVSITRCAFAEFTPPPAPNGYVRDDAHVLSAQTIGTINAINQELDQKTGAQIAVFTTPTIGDTSAEEASIKTARAWKVGSKQSKNGLLILVALKDRKVRTEVGDGLEGMITDGTTGEVRDQVIVPAFKQGNFNGGVLGSVQTYAGLIAKESQISLNSLTNLPQPHFYRKKASAGPPPLLIIIVFILLMVINNLFPNKRRTPSITDGLGGLFGFGINYGGSFGGGSDSGGFGGGSDFGGFGGGDFSGGGSSGSW